MGVPSGNFSSASTGRLQVVFSGDLSKSGGGQPGWANPGDPPDLLIRCTVGSGETQQVAFLRLYTANSAIIERDYVGGSGNVPVAMEVVQVVLGGGPSTIRGKDLRITCRLFRT